MKKKSLLLSAALLCAAGVSAQSLPEGMTALLPDGVKANIDQNKKFYAQKNIVVAGSPTKGYYAFFQAADADHGEELWITDGTQPAPAWSKTSTRVSAPPTSNT